MMYIKKFLTISFLLLSLSDAFFISTSSVNRQTRSPRIVRVENYSIPVAEDGVFYLYEVYEEKLVLQPHPAFHFSLKKFDIGTMIRNYNNQTIGYVMGELQNYYPITPRPINTKMYCGHYNLDDLALNRYIVLHTEKFFSTKDFKDRVKLLPELGEKMCMIYVY